MSYNHAQSYCTWVNAELSTEAQWEKVLRGTGLSLYPWENSELAYELVGYRSDVVAGSFRVAACTSVAPDLKRLKP